MAHHHHQHHSAPPRGRSLSLFRMSAGSRLAIALLVSGLLWAAIGWALA
jgi:hypothetical protein